MDCCQLKNTKKRLLFDDVCRFCTFVVSNPKGDNETMYLVLSATVWFRQLDLVVSI